eukprot:TRINITY_DN34371_c0_g1_i1.p1 TRINITY_DN34371_c0_g1~~TRINITY_DN34371_c0_g1_i1.p1  ORF type:complete len:528 (+),score=92.38 TRINITY_DN34371_c0_g1_i1:232-1815(+)
MSGTILKDSEAGIPKHSLQDDNEMGHDVCNSDDPRHLSIARGEGNAPSIFAGTVADIAKQHCEWSQELEAVDHKQADLMLLQWKLVRNQTGMLAQQIVDMRKIIDDLCKEQQLTTVKIEHYQGENENFELSLKLFVRQLFEKAEQNLVRVRQEIEGAAHKREAAVADALTKLNNITCDARKPNNSSLASEVQKMRTDVNLLMKQVPGIVEHTAQTREEVSTGLASVMDQVRKVRALHEKTMSDSSTHGEALESRMLGFLEKERNARDEATQKLHCSVASLHTDHRALKEELTPLRNRLQEVEHRSISTTQDISDFLDAKFSEPAARLQGIERRMEHIQASINQENVARHALGEVFEQMLKTERTKLMNVISQRATSAKLETEHMQKTLTELIEKEASDRSSNAEVVMSQFTRMKASVDERVSICEHDCQNMEQKYKVVQNGVHECDMKQRKFDEQINGTLRTHIAEIHTAIKEERASREEGDRDIEERIEFLGDFHDKFRETFMQKVPRASLLGNSRNQKQVMEGQP